MSAQCEFRGHGKCSCQDGVWQVCGRNVAGVWQECGRSVAGVATADVWQEWQLCGRNGNGRHVAGMLCLQCQALNSLHNGINIKIQRNKEMEQNKTHHWMLRIKAIWSRNDTTSSLC